MATPRRRRTYLSATAIQKSSRVAKRSSDKSQARKEIPEGARLVSRGWRKQLRKFGTSKRPANQKRQSYASEKLPWGKLIRYRANSSSVLNR